MYKATSEIEPKYGNDKFDTREARRNLRAELIKILEKTQNEASMTITGMANKIGVTGRKLGELTDCDGYNVKLDSLVLYLLRLGCNVNIYVEHPKDGETGTCSVNRSLSALPNQPDDGSV